MKVVVLSSNNKTLMPCTEAKAKHLLKQKKAKVARLKPFTIRLTFDSTEYLQFANLKSQLEEIYKHFGINKRPFISKGKPQNTKDGKAGKNGRPDGRKGNFKNKGPRKFVKPAPVERNSNNGNTPVTA